MVDKVIARLQIKDRHFEIWVDCDEAMKIKNGQSNDIRKALLVDSIFKDARKGEVAGNLDQYFHTEDVQQIAMKIIKEGEVQISAAYRNKETAALKNRIIDQITASVIDSTNNMPVPRKRIELALEQIHYNFDLRKPEKQQTEELIEKLKSVLPIKVGELNYHVEFPMVYANEVFSAIKRFASLKSSSTSQDKASADFSVKPGDKEGVLSKLKSVTHGEIVIKEVI